MKSLTGTIAMSTVLLGACGAEPSAPPAPAIATAVSATLVSTPSAAPNDPAIAIDDALSRVVAGMDVTTRKTLTGPLVAVRSALRAGDGAALRGAVAVALNALALPVAANDARAPELATIALALDAAITK